MTQQTERPGGRPGRGLEAFFHARSIAIVGVSEDPAKIGGPPVHMLLKHGYAGTVYPVNPKGGTVQGLPVYTSVSERSTAPDLAILAVPAGATAVALRDSAARGVKCVIVLSSGFAELGAEGAALQAELVDIAHRRGLPPPRRAARALGRGTDRRRPRCRAADAGAPAAQRWPLALVRPEGQGVVVLDALMIPVAQSAKAVQSAQAEQAPRV